MDVTNEVDLHIVRSFSQPIEKRLAAGLKPMPNGCMEWQGNVHPNGYGRIGYRGEGRWVHRVAWEVANGPIPEELEINHLCYNRKCANLDHLEIVSHAENMAYNRGRHYSSKYTEADVQRLLAVHATHPELSIRQLARKCHIGYGTVWRILKGIWRENAADRPCQPLKSRHAKRAIMSETGRSEQRSSS